MSMDFVVPVPKKSVPAYRRMAKKAGKIWREHGARHEFLSRKLEVHGHDRPGVLAMDILAFVRIARDCDDLRIL
jgi:uncharacterized protein YbaA (DUF1428 family)